MTDLLGRLAARARGEARAPHALQPRPATAFESAAPAVAIEIDAGAPAELAATTPPPVAPPDAGPRPPGSMTDAPRAPAWPAAREAGPPALAAAAPAASPLDAPRTAERMPAATGFAIVDDPAPGDDDGDAIAAPLPPAMLRQRVAAALGPRPLAAQPAAPAAPERRRAPVAAASHSAAAGDQIVQVTIGRIDVRAAIAAPAAAPAPPPREPMLTLAEYLRGGKQ